MENNLNLQHRIKSDLKVSEDLLDNWRFQMAIEVIEHLKNKRPVLCAKSKITEQLNFFESKDFAYLFDILKDRITKFQAETTLDFKNLEDIKVELNIYYSESIISQLEQTIKKTFPNLLSELQKFLAKDIELASPKNLMFFLKELLQDLWQIKNNLKNLKAEAIRNESRGWKAYLNLGIRQNEDGIWNSLSFSLKSKLQFEIYETYSKFLFDLIQLFQYYHELSKSSYMILESIESSLKQKCSLEFTTDSVFSDLNKINHDEQLQLLKTGAGQYLNCLSKSELTCQEIELELLENLQPTAQSISIDFQARFLELTILSRPLASIED